MGEVVAVDSEERQVVVLDVKFFQASEVNKLRQENLVVGDVQMSKVCEMQQVIFLYIYDALSIQFGSDSLSRILDSA